MKFEAYTDLSEGHCRCVPPPFRKDTEILTESSALSLFALFAGLGVGATASLNLIYLIRRTPSWPNKASLVG